MEEKIYQVLRKHKLPLKKREELIVDLLALFNVSESEFENKLYAKCIEGMPDMTIDEFNDALSDWVQKEVKRKQIEEFDAHSR
tara:strand:+ start:55 stop:303 length:249 start_codon:yes stop_codon:yes gene_type:complete